MNTRETTLIESCTSGNIAQVTELLKDKSIDINFVCTYGDFRDSKYQITPLITACRTKQFEIVKLLISDSRIDINKKVISGGEEATHTALDEAIYNGDLSIVRLLLVDNRVNKSNISELIYHVSKIYSHHFVREDLINQELQKFIMLCVDQAANGSELFEKISPINSLINLMFDDTSLDPDFPIPQSLTDLPKEEQTLFSMFFANWLFLNKKTDTSLQSIVSAIKNHAPDNVTIEEINTKFNASFLSTLCNHQETQETLNKLYEEEKTSYRFNNLRQRKSALTFLNGFFSDPRMKRLNTNHFAEKFENIPLDIRKRIAGFLFKVPEDLMNTIDEKIISDDEKRGLIRNI